MIEQNNFVIKQRLELIQKTSLIMGEEPGYDELFQFHIIIGQGLSTKVIGNPCIEK